MRTILKVGLLSMMVVNLTACYPLYFRGENPGYNFEMAEAGPGLKIPPKVDAVSLNSRYDIPPVSDTHLGKVNIQPPDFNEAQQ